MMKTWLAKRKAGVERITATISSGDRCFWSYISCGREDRQDRQALGINVPKNTFSSPDR